MSITSFQSSAPSEFRRLAAVNSAADHVDKAVAQNRVFSANQSATVSSAITEAKALASESIERIKRWGAEDQRIFKQYFGSTSPQIRSEVLFRFEGIHKYLSKITLKQFGLLASDAPKTLYGIASPRNNRIFLGENFFAAPTCRTKFDTKAGTILHEVAHMVPGKNGKNASDHCPHGTKKDVYSGEAVRKLANSLPSSASQLAQAIEWYAERDK